MLGGMFAGHDQSGGETIEHDGKKYKLFYGMSSSTAMHKYSGGVKDYRWVTSCVAGHGVNILSLPGPQRAKRWSWSIVVMSTILCRTFWGDCGPHAHMWEHRS